MAVMVVPEAPVNEDHGIPSREDNIRFAGKEDMYAETKSRGVEPFPQYQFRFGILPANAGHHPAAHFTADDVSHSQHVTWMLRVCPLLG